MRICYPPVKKAFICLSYFSGELERKLISAHKMHEICFYKQNLFLRKLRLNQRNAPFCKISFRNESGFFWNFIKGSSFIRIKNIGNNPVAFDFCIQLNGFEGSVYILIRQAYNIISKLWYAVLVKPVWTVDYISSVWYRRRYLKRISWSPLSSPISIV